MNFLDKLPSEILEHKPDFFEERNLKYVVLDNNVYLITNEDITEEKLMSIWKKTGFRKQKKIKYMIVKSNDKTFKIQVVDNFYITCECTGHKKGESCEHLDKVRKFFT